MEQTTKKMEGIFNALPFIYEWFGENSDFINYTWAVASKKKDFRMTKEMLAISLLSNELEEAIEKISLNLKNKKHGKNERPVHRTA